MSFNTKLEGFARACPKFLIPSEIIETFDSIQQKTFSERFKKGL